MGVRRDRIPEFGEYIEETRKRRGLTQVTFSEKVGVSQQSVSRWERGDIPPFDVMPRIAQVLGVPVESLASFEPRSPVLIADRVALMEARIGALENSLGEMGKRLDATERRFDALAEALRSSIQAED